MSYKSKKTRQAAIAAANQARESEKDSPFIADDKCQKKTLSIQLSTSENALLNRPSFLNSLPNKMPSISASTPSTVSSQTNKGPSFTASSTRSPPVRPHSSTPSMAASKPPSTFQMPTPLPQNMPSFMNPLPNKMPSISSSTPSMVNPQTNKGPSFAASSMGSPFVMPNSSTPSMAASEPIISQATMTQQTRKGSPLATLSEKSPLFSSCSSIPSMAASQSVMSSSQVNPQTNKGPACPPAPSSSKAVFGPFQPSLPSKFTTPIGNSSISASSGVQPQKKPKAIHVRDVRSMSDLRKYQEFMRSKKMQQSGSSQVAASSPSITPSDVSELRAHDNKETPSKDCENEPLNNSSGETSETISRKRKAQGSVSSEKAREWPDSIKVREKEELFTIDDEGKIEKVSGTIDMYHVDKLSTGTRYIVDFNGFNQPIGRGGSLLVKYLGQIAKTQRYCSIGEISWHRLNKQYKVDIVKLVRSKFVIPEGELLNKAMLKHVDKQWRQFKYSLKKGRFNPETRTKEEIYDDTPCGHSRDNWIRLVEYWYSEKGQKLAENGRDARALQNNLHTTGATSFAN